MQLSTISTKEEPLLSRTMLKAVLDFEKATPSYPEVTSLIAVHLKKDEKLIAIRHVHSYFGSKKADVTAYVYGDESSKQLIEPRVKAKKEKKEDGKP